jgi:hypothetical protein
MSQSSNSTNLSNVFDNDVFEHYFDDIFQQLPIKFTTNTIN